MEWISVKEKLPPVCCRVLVCRQLRIVCLARPVLTYDIGMLKGTEPGDRWRLDSQQYCVLPCEPTLESGIVSHWMKLPELPEEI